MKYWRNLLRAVSGSLFLWPALTLANVRISSFADTAHDTWEGDMAGMTWDDTICIYNSGGAAFKVTARGSGTGDAFTLQGPQDLAYTVTLKGSSLHAGDPPTAFATGAHTVPGETDCGGTPNAALQIAIDGDTLSAAKPGEYHGTLTLILEPN